MLECYHEQAVSETQMNTLMSFHRIYWITVNSQAMAISLVLVCQVLLILLDSHEPDDK
jgi:hypothetical protein